MTQPDAAPFAPPVQEPGMGTATAVPGITGSTAGQGGYTDPSGQSHSYASDPSAFRAVTSALGTPSGQQHTASVFDGDPGYAGATATEQLGIPSINNQLQNLIAQRIVAYGDPSLAAQAGFGLDPQAAAFARQNYLSGNGTLARLDRSHEQARQQIINQLAAHGLIDSGETGYQVGNADQSYGNQVYDAQQQALADILGYRNSAQGQLSSLHAATLAALENAFTNYANNPAAYGQIPAPKVASPPAVTRTTPPKVAAPKAPAPNNPVLSALAARSQGLNKMYGLG